MQLTSIRGMLMEGIMQLTSIQRQYGQVYGMVKYMVCSCRWLCSCRLCSCRVSSTNINPEVVASQVDDSQHVKKIELYIRWYHATNINPGVVSMSSRWYHATNINPGVVACQEDSRSMLSRWYGHVGYHATNLNPEEVASQVARIIGHHVQSQQHSTHHIKLTFTKVGVSDLHEACNDLIRLLVLVAWI